MNLDAMTSFQIEATMDGKQSIFTEQCELLGFDTALKKDETNINKLLDGWETLSSSERLHI